MNNLPKNFYLYLLAAILLVGLGIYYFIFERQNTVWWVALFGGALLNLYLAWQTKNQAS